MVTSPECNVQFSPLLQIIKDSSAPNNDHVDAYLTLTERLREEEEGFLTEVCKHVSELVGVFKRDIISNQIELCQAALQTLGHCLYQEQISKTFTDYQGKDILNVLSDVIASTSDKGVCTRAMWCIAKQNLQNDSFHNQLIKILKSIECALKKELQSPTVDNEALCVIERFLEQFPEDTMIEVAMHWCSIPFSLTVSSAGKVREHALSVISNNMNQILSAREEVVKWLLPALKTGLITELTKLCNERKELFVLKVWKCVVPVLGKALHRSSLINDILKIVEQGFKNSSVAVQIESYTAWQVLIDNFAESQDVLSSAKRVNLIMVPLLNSAVKDRNEKVESARLQAWWHFVCAFELKKLLQLFDKICVPLLQFIFGTGIDHVSLLKSKDSFGDLRCPPTPNTGKSISSFETPKATARRSLRDVGAPKTPTLINASFAKTTKDKLLKQGCEILVNILAMDRSYDSPSWKATIDGKIDDAVFHSPGDFERHATVLINAVREAIKACGHDIPDVLVCSLWNELVDQVDRLVKQDISKMFESFFLPLLASAEEIIEGGYITTTSSLRFIEKLSNVSTDVLNHHNKSLQSKDNPQGSTAILLIHHLLSPQLIQDGQNNERLYSGFQNLVASVISAPSGQLSHVQATLQILENSASLIKSKSCLWRLWRQVVGPLNDYILKSNEVNQGNALEHDFTSVYLAFLLPVKELFNDSLDQEMMRITNKGIEDLYRTFSRAAALVSSLDSNVYAEELCGKLLVHWEECKNKDVNYLSGIGNLVSVVIECMDYTTTQAFSSKSPLKSPSKWTKKIQQPLGNFKSVVQLTGKVLIACYDAIKNMKTDNQCCIFAVILTTIVDNLSAFYQHLNGPSIIVATIDALATSLVPIFQHAHQSSKLIKSNVEKAIFNKKFIQKVERLWTDILTSVQSRHGEPYSNELLANMSPLLEVMFVHQRRQLKNQTIQFWNATFGTSSSLTYPEKLGPVLKAAKDKACLTLPGWKEANIPSPVEIEESSQLTQPQGSPVRIKPLMFFGGSPKMKGSFLHKAAEAEKAVEKSSPKKSWTEPRLPSKRKTSNRNTHARRKLPLTLLDDDSQDFVKIAPSPTKKRLLTEHQKEVMREQRMDRAMFSFVDQSLDGTILSQEMINTPSPADEVPPLLKGKKSGQTSSGSILNQTADFVTTTDISDRKTEDSNEIQKPDMIVEQPKSLDEQPKVIPEAMEMIVADTQFTETENPTTCQETPTKEQPIMSPCKDVTSPDVIPSSQISSDSGSPSFKSLGRSRNLPISNMVVLLNNMTESDKSLKGITQYYSPQKTKLADKDNTTVTKINEKVTEGKNDGNEDVQPGTMTDENNEQETVPQALLSSVKFSAKKRKNTIKLSVKTSPVSGRTRRSLQLKITPKKQAKITEITGKIKEDTTETIFEKESIENSSETQDDTDECTQTAEKSENQQCMEEDTEQTIVEKPINDQEVESKATATNGTSLQNDPVSSPISCAKIKFMRPSTESPTHASLKRIHSPVASPTTSILKRSTGRYDSPSPPNKVRRVSFAQPLAQEAHDEIKDKRVSSTQEALESECKGDNPSSSRESTQCVTTTPLKSSDSLPFTLIKRRRKTPTKTEKDTFNTPCIYPDLVDCSLPVEQILPSLTSLTWSRGLGQLVYAQNIRTIGNLSALKEHQIKNLPIRSPKVQTLRSALESFHQKTKGFRTKSDKKSSTNTNENTIPTIVQCDEPSENNDGTREIPKDASLGLSYAKEKSKQTKEIDQSENRSACGEKNIPLGEDQKEKIVAAPSLEEENNSDTTLDEPTDYGAHTPPLPASDIQLEKDINSTPTKGSFTKPIVLFTPDDEETQATEDNYFDKVKSELEDNNESIFNLEKYIDKGAREITSENDNDGTGENISDSHITELVKDDQMTHNIDEMPVVDLREDVTPEKKVYESLKSIVDMATPEVLERLSSEQIFDAHKNLTDLMARVVHALQSKIAKPL